MTNDEFIRLSIDARLYLKDKYGSFNADYLLDEIIKRVREKEK